MDKPFVFFDLGQTLVDEWDFIDFFDQRFLETLNGFGARIDKKNYRAVRNSVIRDRTIGHGSVRELIVAVCKLLSPPGYENVIECRLEPEIGKARKELFKISNDCKDMLVTLEKRGYEMGLIANQSEDILDLLQKSDVTRFFKVKAISSSVKLQKPDPRIFELATRQAQRAACECVMVGDRLDTDICPAKRAGMTTIRTTNSLFSLQEPAVDCEIADFDVARLSEIPVVLQKIS